MSCSFDVPPSYHLMLISLDATRLQKVDLRESRRQSLYPGPGSFKSVGRSRAKIGLIQTSTSLIIAFLSVKMAALFSHFSKLAAATILQQSKLLPACTRSPNPNPVYQLESLATELGKPCARKDRRPSGTFALTTEDLVGNKAMY